MPMDNAMLPHSVIKSRKEQLNLPERLRFTLVSVCKEKQQVSKSN